MTEISRLIPSEVIHASDVTAAANENLEWPHCPERNDGDEGIIFKQPPFFLALFDSDVVAQKATVMRLQISTLGRQLLSRFNRNRKRRPDLAVRVRIAGAHHGATVFKDLHVVDEVDFS